MNKEFLFSQWRTRLKRACQVLGLCTALVCCSNASAGVMVTFDSFEHVGSEAVDYVVKIDDNTAGVFTIRIDIASTSPNVGDIRGVGFDIGYNITAADILGSDLTGIAPNTTSGGGGNNLKGGGTTAFDWLVDIGKAGSSGEFFKSTTLTVNRLGQDLTASTFSRFGIRAQSVGSSLTSGGDGSSKDVSIGDHSGSPGLTHAPEPASLAIWSLLALGCGGAAARSRRRKAAQSQFA